MSLTSLRPSDQTLTPAGFRHEAFVYRDEREFLKGTVAFVRDGLEADEPVLAMVQVPKIHALRDALGAEAKRVRFADMGTIGTNPARIIPAWLEFVAEHEGSGRRMRGIGEPIWSGRTPAELVECQLHEWLLNLAVPDAAPMWLLCPYDGRSLGRAVTDEARCSHPHVWESDRRQSSTAFHRARTAVAPWVRPLPPAPADTRELRFDAGDPLSAARSFIAEAAALAGFTPETTAEVVVAAHEVVTNSVRHGGGRGTLRLWNEDTALVCEVTDAGRIDDPLVGRIHPSLVQVGGRGLWLVNQLCDLVQLRHESGRNVVRLHLRGATGR